MFAARSYRFSAGIADKLVGETKPLDNLNAFDFTIREPIGVCALITPWNSPIGILTNKLAPCLAAGNTCVVKPSEFTSVSTLFFASLVERAGFPPGVFNVVVGKAGVGRALVSSPHINMISFTGSVDIGRIIAKQAGENILPVTLELGGKSANIILADADLDRAIPGSRRRNLCRVWTDLHRRLTTFGSPFGLRQGCEWHFGEDQIDYIW